MRSAKIRRARDFILKADSYDETLWDFFISYGDTYCGDAKDLNKSFVRGCNKYLNNTKEFYIYDEGWIDACGWSVLTLAEHICKQEESEDE